MIQRLMVLATLALSALACELGGGRCAWKGAPARYRVEDAVGPDAAGRRPRDRR
ncbi:hypothetical protein [Cupriavidus pauculus]|jgi:hypothetical protein|uniref:hypothetical protein n=1 Tax=Cupriavidus pauculus TaxID=82633 RepID=UPI0030FBCFDB